MLLFTNCGSTKHATSNDPKIPATFDYSPPSRGQVGSANLTIALVRAKYVGNKKADFYASPFKEMAASMGDDFEELLTAKGFTVRGPFGSRDEMVYNDKLNTDFALDVDIDMDQSQYNMRNVYNQGFGIYVPASWKTFGQIILNGKLVLTASSPQYGEKIWKKSIAIDPATFTYASNIKFAREPSMSDLLNDDNKVYNSLTRELQNYYQQALNLAWKQIEVLEMKSVADQAKKADKKSS